MRPTVAVDGSNTSTAQESALWKSTMLDLYGTEWAIDLASHKDVTEEEPPGVLMTAGTLPASVTSLDPSAAASDPVNYSRGSQSCKELRGGIGGHIQSLPKGR